MERNLTSGSVLKSIAYFSLPYLLSYFLQTLYGMADLFIIGQFDGMASTTAVSIGSQVMHMITVMIVGVAMGTTVTIGRAIGANHPKDAARYIGNTVVLFLAGSVVLAAVLVGLVGPIVGLVSTPEEAVQGTTAYLTICFLGIPCITAYNIIAAIYRGLGDSKSPMYFIAVACAANIGLDCLFMGVFRMGPAGAALGTTLSQAVSVAVSLVVILRRKTGIRLEKADFRPDRAVLGDALHRHPGDAAGRLHPGVLHDHHHHCQPARPDRCRRRGHCGKDHQLPVPGAVLPLSTVSALGAQNIGAGKHERVDAILRYAIGIGLGFGGVMALLMQFIAPSVVRPFTAEEAVVLAGASYLRGYIFDCMFAGMQFSFSGYFCAYGKSGLSFLHNTLSILLVRVPGAYLASRFFPQTLLPMGLASAGGSLFSSVVCVGFYLWLRHRRNMPESASRN